MTSLDTLARSSADAIHSSVQDVHVPIGGVVGAAQTASMWRMAGYAVAGAAAGAAVVFTLMIAGPDIDESAESVVPTTSVVVPTTLVGLPVTPTTPPPAPQQEAPPVVATPQDTGGDELAPEPADIDPPPLELLSPSDGEHLENKIVTFSGSTEPDAAVLASGKFPAAVDSNGLWNVDLVLAAGANGVVLRATDAAGNTSEMRVTVYLDVEEPVVEEPKETTTTTTTVAEWKFTANQKYGSCSEPVPYDVFSGKAEPGTTVTITSPYGSGTAEVNDDGAWSVRVEFPEAPFNEQFTVKVKDHTGSKKTFPFVSLFEG
jgi:hypothetical protein